LAQVDVRRQTAVGKPQAVKEKGKEAGRKETGNWRPETEGKVGLLCKTK
jgi:hypothetical protein